VTRPLTLLLSALALASAAWPASARAHGVQGRAETPIPISAFFWVAAVVLIVSFVGLGVGWSKPRLARIPWRPAPALVERFAFSPTTVWVARTVVLAAFLLLLAAAAFGSTRLNNNIAPVAIFVCWWVGLVPVSVLLGDIWRHVNPWLTLGRLLRLRDETDRALPGWVGWWPAALLLVGWAWLELVYPTAAKPRLIAGVMVAYTAVTLGGMWRYGVRRWLDHGEVFTVYTGVLAALSPWESREVDGRRRLGLRPPVVGVTALGRRPAQVAFIGALVATVCFDGLSGSDFWARRDVTAAERLIDLGIEGFTAGIIVATIGLLVTLAVVIGAYQLCAWASGRIGRFPDMHQIGTAFAHTLIPIALAYFVAHYFTLFVFSGQDIVRLASDPFGTGANLLGTADFRIDFQAVSANTIWAVQVGAIVVGHVLGLALAHDRAVQLSPTHRLAVASQGPMLLLMVALTVLGLWSLSEGMARV
jgi:hypothetical protein